MYTQFYINKLRSLNINDPRHVHFEYTVELLNYLNIILEIIINCKLINKSVHNQLLFNLEIWQGFAIFLSMTSLNIIF